MDDHTAAGHRRTWDLIPWVVNGSASDAERREVERHVERCPDCNDELVFQRQLHAAITARPARKAASARDPGPALQRFWARVEDADGAPRATRGMPARRGAAAAAASAPRPARWTKPLVAAVVVQAIGLAALIGVVSERPRAADHPPPARAAATVAPASIRLVPAPTLRLADLRELLARSNLEVVDARGDAAHFGVTLRPGAPAVPTAELIDRLRREPGVLAAEPIGPPSPPSASSSRP